MLRVTSPNALDRAAALSLKRHAVYHKIPLFFINHACFAFEQSATDYQRSHYMGKLATMHVAMLEAKDAAAAAGVEEAAAAEEAAAENDGA